MLNLFWMTSLFDTVFTPIVVGKLVEGDTDGEDGGITESTGFEATGGAVDVTTGMGTGVGAGTGGSTEGAGWTGAGGAGWAV